MHIHRLKVVSKSRLRKEKQMLWTIFVILLVLWLLGMVSSYTMGGFIHLLLVPQYELAMSRSVPHCAHRDGKSG